MKRINYKGKMNNWGMWMCTETTLHTSGNFSTSLKLFPKKFLNLKKKCEHAN